jgi:hypothetical protein
VVGAVSSGLYTAASLVLHTSVLFPGWHWEYQALFGFLIFAGVMIWMVWERQSKLNDLRPHMVLGSNSGATAVRLPGTSELEFKLHPTYRNAGKKPAYQFRIRLGLAPLDNPQSFKALADLDSANPIEPSTLEHGRTIRVKYKITEEKGAGINVKGPQKWLIYCAIRYSDSAEGGKIYSNENWFEYKLGGNFSHATLAHKASLEPYVRAAYPD